MPAPGHRYLDTRRQHEQGRWPGEGRLPSVATCGQRRGPAHVPTLWMAIAQRGVGKQSKCFRTIYLLVAVVAGAGINLATPPSPANAAVVQHWVYLTVDWTYLDVEGQGATAISLKDIGGNCDQKDFSYRVLIPGQSVSQTNRLFVSRDAGSCQLKGPTVSTS